MSPKDGVVRWRQRVHFVHASQASEDHDTSTCMRGYCTNPAVSAPPLEQPSYSLFLPSYLSQLPEFSTFP